MRTKLLAAMVMAASLAGCTAPPMKPTTDGAIPRSAEVEYSPQAGLKIWWVHWEASIDGEPRLHVELTMTNYSGVESMPIYAPVFELRGADGKTYEPQWFGNLSRFDAVGVSAVGMTLPGKTLDGTAGFAAPKAEGYTLAVYKGVREGTKQAGHWKKGPLLFTWQVN